jgi:hypothetical protein
VQKRANRWEPRALQLMQGDSCRPHPVPGVRATATFRSQARRRPSSTSLPGCSAATRCRSDRTASLWGCRPGMRCAPAVTGWFGVAVLSETRRQTPKVSLPAWSTTSPKHSPTAPRAGPTWSVPSRPVAATTPRWPPWVGESHPRPTASAAPRHRADRPLAAMLLRSWSVRL